MILDADTEGFDRILARLDGLERAAEVASPAMRQTLQRLATYARGIAHVKTGRLRASLRAEGPVSIGSGILEGLVTPLGVPYAIQEVRRGGEHDYAGRTLTEARGEIDALIAALAEDVAAYIRGA